MDVIVERMCVRVCYCMSASVCLWVLKHVCLCVCYRMFLFVKVCANVYACWKVWVLPSCPMYTFDSLNVLQRGEGEVSNNSVISK